MSRIFRIVVLSVMFPVGITASAVTPGSAQVSEEKCEGTVYQSKELSQRARIDSKPAPVYTPQARADNLSGYVFLTAVLCRSGHVTDIQVVKGLPHGLTEAAIAAAKKIKFEPEQ